MNPYHNNPATLVQLLLGVRHYGPINREVDQLLQDAAATLLSVATERGQLKARIAELEREVKAHSDAFDAQPWASDEPAKVQLDKITARIAELEALLLRIRDEGHACEVGRWIPDKLETDILAAVARVRVVEAKGGAK